MNIDNRQLLHFCQYENNKIIKKVLERFARPSYRRGMLE